MAFTLSAKPRRLTSCKEFYWIIRPNVIHVINQILACESATCKKQVIS